MYCPKCGKPIADGAAFCSYCGAAAADPAAAPSAVIPDDPAGVVARIRRREVVVNVLWLVIGVVQLFLVYTAVAGVWNIVNAVFALRNCRNIVPGNHNVIPWYEGRKTGLIIMAVVNLVLGGVVGAFLAAYELHIRQVALDNSGAFDPAAATAAAEKAASDSAARGDGFVAVVCPGCSEQYTIKYRGVAVVDGAVKVTCPKCKTVFDAPVNS